MKQTFNLHYIQQSQDGTELTIDQQCSATSFYNAYASLVKQVESTGDAVIYCEITPEEPGPC